MLSILNYIKFYRKCYRSDNRNLLIWNIHKIEDSYWLDSATKELATGGFPQIPLPIKTGEPLLKKRKLKIRETSLVYGVAFITGKLRGLSGFVSERYICSPLVYFDAEIEKNSSENENVSLDDFPVLTGGIYNVVLGNIVNWLNRNSIIENALDFIRFPKLVNNTFADDSSLSAISAATLILVDRPKGSRGILHELKTLESSSDYSPPLKALFSAICIKVSGNITDANKIPGLLSSSQLKALEILSNEALCLVSGPPGTGKSYTITAIALDRLLQGESVLIVSEIDQALDVISNKLAENYYSA